jgi:penicillin-binding protein 2
LGIDLPGEKKGFLPSKKWKEETKGERWYIGDTYNISIGQGDVLVSPLQIASMTATVANNGTLYKPHLLKSVIDPKTFKEDVKSKEILSDNVVSSQNLKIVALGMKDCVDYGSCRRLKSLPMQTAGKTGTAQWNQSKDPHAWFTSFAPFQNPQIVVTILIEEGGGNNSNPALLATEKFYSWWWQEKASKRP